MTSADYEPWSRLAPGSSWRGFAPGIAGEDDGFPVIAVRGAQSGPRIVITGGVHGDEYEGPSAIFKFMGQLEPGRLSGQVTAVPVANPAAWARRQRTTPVDDGDLNRHFPDRHPETPTGQLAERIFETFVRHCDLLIDLHSGGLRMVHLPLIGWYRQTAPDAENLARRFHGALHPWIIPDAVGVLTYEAVRLGKTAFGAEWGGGGGLDLAGVEAICTGLLRTLQVLDVYEGLELPVAVDDRSPIAGDYLVSPHTGLFQPGVRLGEAVAQGQPLGEILNAIGERLAAPTAPVAGTVAALPHLAWVLAGERIAYIG